MNELIDIEMPDGTIISDVPAGTPKDEIERRWLASRRDTTRSANEEWRRKYLARIAGAKTRDASPLHRSLLSIGTGIDDLAMGARQLWNGAFGTEERGKELESMAADKRAVNDAIKENTYGGTALGIAGNIAPSVFIPAGGTSNLVAQGFRWLPKAYKALQTTGKLGTGGLVTDSALTGGLFGALEPTVEGESRLQNTLLGSVTNTLLPLLGLGGNQVRRMVTNKGGEQRAADSVIEGMTDVGDKPTVLRQTIENLQQRGPDGSIPLSTAASIDSPALARLERGSRTRNTNNWTEFDQTQYRALSDSFDRATSEAAELASRTSARRKGWQEGWDRVRQSVDMPTFMGEINALGPKLDAALLSADAANPTVRAMLQTIRSEIARYGDNISPEVIQQIRANLSGKYRPLSQNAYESVPRDSAATREVIGELDRILNVSSGGAWQSVPEAYRAASVLVDQSKAAGRVRETFYDRATGNVLKAADDKGDIPVITETGLIRAMKRGNNRAGDTLLSDTAIDQLNTVLKALRQQNITQRVAKTATSGGGSNTMSDRFAAQAAGRAADALANSTGAPVVAQALFDKLRIAATRNRDKALADALQNPDQMLRILIELEKSGQPLTAEMEALAQMFRSSGIAAQGYVSP